MHTHTHAHITVHAHTPRTSLCMCYTGDSAADHNIENENTHLIWAFGQVSPEYHHRFFTDAEFNVTQNQRFFPVDQLKYHGGKNRGATTINFYQGDTGRKCNKAAWLVAMIL